MPLYNRDCQCFALSSSAIGLTQSPKTGIAVFRFTQNVFPIHWPYPKHSGLSMLRIVFLGHWINPKPKNWDCRFSLHSKRLPNPLALPKFLGTVGFVSLRRLPRLWPYPKPFKQTLRVCFAFLTLPNFRKRAFDLVSH